MLLKKSNVDKYLRFVWSLVVILLDRIMVPMKDGNRKAIPQTIENRLLVPLNLGIISPYFKGTITIDEIT